MKKLVLWFPLVLPFYLLRFKIGPLPTTALEIAFFALIITFVFTNVSQKWSILQNGWQKIAPWRWPIAAWIVATLIAVIVAPNHLAALGLWRAYILEPLIYFVLLLAYLETEDDRWEVVKAFITVTIGVCVWSIFQFATNIGIPHPWGTDALATRRATGPFPFPNAVALWCAPVVALCVGMVAQTPSRSPFVRQAHDLSLSKVARGRSLLFLGAAAGIVATLLAKSSTGTIAILVCMVVAGIAHKASRKWTLVTLVVAITIAVITPQIRTPLTKLLGFKNWSGVVRMIIWKEDIAMLKAHPVFGAGFGGYPIAIQPYRKATFIETFQYPHNILLNLWTETGILGVLAFAWVCITWIRVTFRRQHPRSSPVASDLPSIAYLLPLIAILIHGLADVPYFKNDLAFAFWIFAAFAILVQKDNNPAYE